MKINAKKIISERKVRAWSQQHLADVSSVSLRTIQRVENNGSGSLETVKALASCFELDVVKLFETEINIVKQTSKLKSKIVVFCSLVVALFGSVLFIAPSSLASNITIKSQNQKVNSSEGFHIYSNHVEIFLPENINYEILIDFNWQANSSSLSSGSVKVYFEHSVVIIENALITNMESGTKITTDYAKLYLSELNTADKPFKQNE